MKIKPLINRAIIAVKTFFFKCFELLKNKEVWLYLIFGVLTTLVDYAVTFALYRIWGDAIEANKILIHVADAIAWAAAVIFAFITNRIIVFKSERTGAKNVLGEFAAFAGGRVLTLALQEIFVYLFFNVLGINKYVVKIAASVIVVILNYFISRFIFGKNTPAEGDEISADENDDEVAK